MVRPKKSPISKSYNIKNNTSNNSCEEDHNNILEKSSYLSKNSEKIISKENGEIEPPRKRRMASLNAEFLVHYTSKSNNHAVAHDLLQNTNIINNEIDNINLKSNLKRKRSISDNSILKSSKKMESKTNINKPGRGRPKKIQEISRVNTKKGRPKKNKMNADNLNFENFESENVNNIKDNDNNNEDYMEITNQSQLDALQIEKYAKILNDFAVQENDEENEGEEGEVNEEAYIQNNEIKINNDNNNMKSKNEKITKKCIRKGRPPKQQPKKIEEYESDNDNDKEELLKKISSIKTMEITPTGRPKREAGLRASAMIIQTNEIEKTKYSYHYSNSNPATPTTNPHNPVLNSLNDQNNNIPTVQNNNNQKLKTSQSFSSFQVPKFCSSVYASLTNKANTNNIVSNSKINLNKISNEKNKYTNSFNNKQSLRQISTTCTLGVSGSIINQNPAVLGNNDDDSSNDVLIIETTQIPKKLSNCNGLNSNKQGSQNGNLNNITTIITEDIIKEHNKIHDTNSSNGTFSSFTRDYIIKWVGTYDHTDEIPYTPGQIPIESFGVKILDEPQYLNVKSRQENNNNNVSIAPNSKINVFTTNKNSNGNNISSSKLNDPISTLVKNTENNEKADIIENKSMNNHKELNSIKNNNFNNSAANHQKICNSNEISIELNILNKDKNTEIEVKSENKKISEEKDSSNGNNVIKMDSKDNKNEDITNNIANNINYFPSKCISAS